ncbi:MAG: hemin ABC transporter substrate-binding protein [Alphaproteobacteria bacterium]|nr:MAG: hemin ABC transporter substrate-binding protein [Alphaproteobacteria bacterium]
MTRFLTFFVLFLFTSTAAAGEAPSRIISIGGALTETIYALGGGTELVGSDTTSYYPEAAAKLPKVGYMRALSAEGVLSLNPDLVILSEESGPPPVLAQLEAAGLTLLKLKAGRDLADVTSNIEAIGKALHREAAAGELVEKMAAEKQALDEKIAAGGAKKRIMFIFQHQGGTPLVAGAHTAADSVIHLAGAENAVSGYDGYKPLSPEAAVTFAPDIILVTSQGLEGAGGSASLLEVPGVALTPAGKDRKFIVMDTLLLLGFGPRIVEAATELHDKADAL